MTTAPSKPAFWLTRCPRCLASFIAPERYERLPSRYGVGCVECGKLSQDQADAEYDRRLAQGRVVAVAETYEAVKRL